MGKKYKISQNGQFLGHFQAHTPADAVVKAVAKYGQYYPTNPNEYFDVQYGFKKGRVYVGEK